MKQTRKGEILLLHRASLTQKRMYFHLQRTKDANRIDYLRTTADKREAEYRLNWTRPEDYKNMADFKKARDQWTKDKREADRKMVYLKAHMRGNRTHLTELIRELEKQNQ